MASARFEFTNLGVVAKYASALRALPNQGAQTIARAVGTLKRRVPAQTKRLIVSRYNIDPHFVAHRLICFGNEGTLTLIAIGRPIGLPRFPGTQQTRTGVRCEVIKGQPFEIAHAFIHTPNGALAAAGAQAYIRDAAGFSAPDYVQISAEIERTQHGYPIGRIAGPGVADMLRDDGNETAIADFAQTVFSSEIARLSIYSGQ